MDNLNDPRLKYNYRTRERGTVPMDEERDRFQWVSEVAYKNVHRIVSRGYDTTELVEQGYGLTDVLFVDFQARIPLIEEDNIREMYKKARAAFNIVEYWPQEKVDEMVLAVGWELQKQETAEELARLAVERSGIGVYEDKVHKIGTKVRGTLFDQIGVKTCGLVEEDKAKGIRKYAKPIGVIANVVPCTNPESTVCCIALSTLKTRNAIICSPHPRTELATYTTVEHIRKALAKSALYIAELAGLKVPKDTKILMVMGDKIGPEDRFSGEKLSPVLTVWKWTDFDEMLDRMEKILKFSGESHSVNIQTELDERINKLGLRANVSRVVCNMGHTEANSGGWTSCLGFTDTLGCGTWAGNISCQNINWRQFLMYTRVAMPLPNYQPSDEELFGAYLKKYGRD